MSLLSSLNAATSGLRVTQAGIGVVSGNVANADTAGYTRRRLAPVQQLAGERTSGVQTGQIERVIDLVAQRQLRLETAGGSYTALTARFAGEIDRLFGAPGGTGSLDGAVNGFTQALQALASDPSSFSVRSAVLDAAGALAGRIGSIADGIQGLRTDAENRLASAVGRANDLLTGIAAVNTRLVAAGGASPALLDERDRLINELSTLTDLQVSDGRSGAVTLMTSSGLVLFDGSAAVKLAFDGRSVLGPDSLFSADDTLRTVGTIRATTIQGASMDAVANGMFRSGEIAAALELRDKVLVQAQRQLDELAAGLATALSDRPDLVAPASAGGFAGFDFDMKGFADGNVVTLDYQDTAANPPGPVQRLVLVPTRNGKLVAQPPLGQADPSAAIMTIEVKDGLDAAFDDIVARLQDGSGPPPLGLFTVVKPAAPGTILRILGKGAIALAGGGTTATGFSGTPAQPQLPLFVDGGRGDTPYIATNLGSRQLTGFAQRLKVNPAVLSDRAKLVVAGPAVPQGDAARPAFMLEAIARAERSFAGATGIAGGAPFRASVADFARRIVETQGAGAELAQRLDEGQQVALAAIESRFAEQTGVNIDQEMALLVQLQTAYGANARIMTAVRDMLDMLMRI